MRVRLKVLPDKPRAAAWPSSARIVRRAVKSVNERDPHHMLLIFCPQEMHSCETAGDKSEEGVGDGRSVWREPSGLHAAYNACHNVMQLRKEKQITKKHAQFESWVVIHPREAGIASRRTSSKIHDNWLDMRHDM